MNDNEIRGENLRIDNLKSMIVRDINNSNLTIGTIYYILKDVVNEIEKLYTKQAEQEYQEFCDLTNSAAAASQAESDEIKAEESDAAAIEKKEEK